MLQSMGSQRAGVVKSQGHKQLNNTATNVFFQSFSPVSLGSACQFLLH